MQETGLMWAPPCVFFSYNETTGDGVGSLQVVVREKQHVLSGL